MWHWCERERWKFGVNICSCLGDIASKPQEALGAEYFCRVLYIPLGINITSTHSFPNPIDVMIWKQSQDARNVLKKKICDTLILFKLCSVFLYFYYILFKGAWHCPLPWTIRTLIDVISVFMLRLSHEWAKHTCIKWESGYGIWKNASIYPVSWTYRSRFLKTGRHQLLPPSVPPTSPNEAGHLTAHLSTNIQHVI